MDVTVNEREPRAFVEAVKQSWNLQLEQQQAVQCPDVCDFATVRHPFCTGNFVHHVKIASGNSVL
jgi:hypothetical protein